MSNALEGSALPLDSRLPDQDQDMDHHDPPSDVHHAANMYAMDPFGQRRSITFIASLNGSLAGPRDFVYYDTTLDTNMPALATNSLRLCTEPNDLPPGTDTLTYPGYHQQIASVSGLHAPIIEDRSPLLAAAFEDSRSGRRLHLETLTSNTVMPFLRFLYTGSYALFGGWEDVPTSVLLHCKMYWLADLYDLPELKSQAYVNVLRQFEFGCSSPEKPIDLCSAIDFAYKTLAGHDTISDAIVQYCVTRCLSHKLHEDPEFKALAFNVRAFHQDLTRVCRDRGYEDESSAIIIRLPYKHFAPDIYASLENPPIAGFDDIIHHFHSSDRFDVESTPKTRQRLAPKGQALTSEKPQSLDASNQAVTVVPCPSPEDVKPEDVKPEDLKPVIPAVPLPIRQLNIGCQAPTLTSSQQEKPLSTNTALPFRQLDDTLAKLSTAPPNPGFFARPPPQETTNARSARPFDYDRNLRTDAQESDRLFAEESPFWRSPSAKYREKRVTFNQKLEDKSTNENKTLHPSRRHGHGFLEARPAKYSYKEFPPWEPQQFNGAPPSTENPFADGMSSEVSQLKPSTKLNEKQPIASEVPEPTKEIKRRKVEGQDRKDVDPTEPWSRPTSLQMQSPLSMAPSSSDTSWAQRNGKTRPVNLQFANVTDVAHFTPSNVSPTLPPTVFGPPQSNPSPTWTNFGPEMPADNTSTPAKVAYAGRPRPLPSGLKMNTQPEPMRMPNSMNCGMRFAAPAAAANPGNHALQDYQMQLMLLEQQNKKRLLMARQEQDSMLSHPEVPPRVNGQPAPDMAPQGSRAGEPSPNLIEMARAPPATSTSEHDRKAVTSLNASSGDEQGREFDVLDEFDFDAFLQGEDATPATQTNCFWQDYQDDKNQLERLINENQRQQVKAMQTQRCFSRVHIPTSGHDISMAQPQVMVLPATTRKWYDAQWLNSRRGLTDASHSDGPIIPSMDDPLSLTIKASSANPSDPTPPANGMSQPMRSSSDSEIDMCDSDSDSDMSWVDVATTEPKPTGSTQPPNTTVAPPASDSQMARTGAKRRSSSSDSEWDFC
jgi:hypothetical protein